MKKKKILVTGGAGYIGSHILLLLAEKNDDVIVVDNLSTGRKENVHYGKLVVGDLGERPFLEALFKEHQFDSIIHFAASIVVDESVANPLKYYKNNTENSLNLINLAVKYGVKNFIFSSTAAVYGEEAFDGCHENAVTNPRNPYGTSKLMTEWILRDVCKHSSLNYISLRYFNVAGANIKGKSGQRCSTTHLIKIASETALGKRDKMIIFGDDYDTSDGTCIRDYIHVDDLAQVHLEALDILEEKGTSMVLNCGYGHGYSVREVVAMMKKVSGNDFHVEMGARRPGDVAQLIANNEKIKKTLNWRPGYDDLELICRSALEWEKKL